MVSTWKLEINAFWFWNTDVYNLQSANNHLFLEMYIMYWTYPGTHSSSTTFHKGFFVLILLKSFDPVQYTSQNHWWLLKVDSLTSSAISDICCWLKRSTDRMRCVINSSRVVFPTNNNQHQTAVRKFANIWAVFTHPWLCSVVVGTIIFQLMQIVTIFLPSEQNGFNLIQHILNFCKVFGLHYMLDGNNYLFIPSGNWQ